MSPRLVAQNFLVRLTGSNFSSVPHRVAFISRRPLGKDKFPCSRVLIFNCRKVPIGRNFVAFCEGGSAQRALISWMSIRRTINEKTRHRSGFAFNARDELFSRPHMEISQVGQIPLELCLNIRLKECFNMQEFCCLDRI